MKNPSDMFRNLLGGFVGGSLGVLFAGFIHPLASPIGLLVGVLLGYWHDIIIGRCIIVYEVFCRININFGGFSHKVSKWYRKASRMTKAWYFRRCRNFWHGLRQVSPAMYCVGRALKWCVYAPFRGLAWLVAEPIRVASIFSVLLVIVASVVLVAVSFEAVPDVGNPGGWDREIIGGILCLVSSLLVCVSRDASKEKQGARYSSLGPVRYVAKGFFPSFVQVLTSACMIVGMISGLFLAIISFMLVFFGGAIFFGVLKGLWHVSSKRQHLLCLSVTAVVTITSVIAFRHSLNGSMLWIISLATGTVSAVTTECTRRLLVVLLSRFGAEMYAGKDPFDLVEIPIKRVFGPIGRWFESGVSDKAIRRIFSW